jgi:hypothetical protein
MIAAARDLDVHVTLELSGLANWYLSNNMDPYDASTYDTWDKLVDFVTSRVNSVNGVTYKDDPTIFQYSVLGEVNPARQSQPFIYALLKRVSDRLKLKDPSHLVGSGGLLHMSRFSGYFDPRKYYEELYAYSSIDICMIHVYQDPVTSVPSSPTSTPPASEWTQLSTYSKFCLDRKKPFIIDEMGLNLNGYSRSVAVKYFDFAFSFSLGVVPTIPVIQFWNLRPGETFDLFPPDDLLIFEVVKKYSAELSFDIDNLGTVSSNTVKDSLLGTMLLNFESSADLNGISGDNSISTSQISFSGSQSLKMPFRFSSLVYGTDDIVIARISSSTWTSDWSQYATSNGKLTCNALLRPGGTSIAEGLFIRFYVTGRSGRVYAQSAQGFSTNFVMSRSWSRVQFRLDESTLQEELTPPSYNIIANGISWVTELSQVRGFRISLVHESNLRWSYGDFLVDDCMLEYATSVQDESIDTSLKVACDPPETVTVTNKPLTITRIASNRLPVTNISSLLDYVQEDSNNNSNTTNSFDTKTSTSNQPYIFDISKINRSDYGPTRYKTSLDLMFTFGIVFGSVGIILIFVAFALQRAKNIRTRSTAKTCDDSKRSDVNLCSKDTLL